MRKLWLGLLVLILLPGHAQLAHGCRGGFLAPYPRTISLAPDETGEPGQVRVLLDHGRDWRIPSPAGLFDLETLTVTTLPKEEIFEGLAFSLGSGRVCFTNFSGQGSGLKIPGPQWPA